MVRLLKHIINSDKREEIIKVNGALSKCIVFWVRRYEEPTRENTVHPNVWRLLEIRDEFFECWNVSSPLYHALFKLVIVKYEHSPNWRNFLDWFLMMIGKSGWKPFDTNRQMTLWRR